MTRRPIEKRGRDVEKTVFLCPGQGSQKPGMGADLLDDPTVARVVGCASDVFGRDMAALLASDDPSDMADPRAAQAAIATLTIAVGRTLMDRGIEPCAVAGFSLGQMSALALSGMISDEDAFALVDVRSRIICDVAEKNPGGMSALLKAEEDDVRALCSRCAEGEVLVPANFNCPGQIVISGSPSALERAEGAWRAQGGRFARLATAGGFHSPLMTPARAPFSAYLETVDFKEARFPVICNTDASPLDESSVRARLVDHLTAPVLFERSIRFILKSHPRCRFVETGFGGVLTGFVRRIDESAARLCVQDAKSLKLCLTETGR